MKKVIKPTILLLLIIFLAVGLFHWGNSMLINKLHDDLGSRNWRVELDYGYTIQQISGNDIVLVKESSNKPTETIISSYITSFSRYGQFAGLLCLDTSAANQSQKCYYILDMQKEILYGPYQTDAYHSFCDKQKIDLSQWIDTNPRPESATFK